jgi:hypothetical protein
VTSRIQASSSRRSLGFLFIISHEFGERKLKLKHEGAILKGIILRNAYRYTVCSWRRVWTRWA